MTGSKFTLLDTLNTELQDKAKRTTAALAISPLQRFLLRQRPIPRGRVLQRFLMRQGPLRQDRPLQGIVLWQRALPRQRPRPLQRFSGL